SLHDICSHEHPAVSSRFSQQWFVDCGIPAVEIRPRPETATTATRPIPRTTPSLYWLVAVAHRCGSVKIPCRTIPRRGGRVVDGSGVENRQGPSPRGFEAHPLRAYEKYEVSGYKLGVDLKQKQRDHQ